MPKRANYKMEKGKVRSIFCSFLLFNKEFSCNLHFLWFCYFCFSSFSKFGCCLCWASKLSIMFPIFSPHHSFQTLAADYSFAQFKLHKYFFPLKGCNNCWHKHNDEDSIIKIMLMRNTTLYVRMCLPKSEYSVSKNRRGNYHYSALRNSVDIFLILIFVRYFRTAIHCHRLLSPTILQQSKQYICNNENTDTAILLKQKHYNIGETTTKIQVQQLWTNKNNRVLQQSKQKIWKRR